MWLIKMKGIGIERECVQDRDWKRESERERETGLNISNRIKYIFYYFSITKLQKPNKNFLKFRFNINRIFTPER